ncbi:family 16 glycosylhydrolase [Alsobacter sp. SYSU M60028]|uniref:Family 16 glycosylhydrolase n=1 Tax=Alsobacter ponti TaxID=2962936 RepID=A0ABT1LE29_9HYPH|nr:family 16 glycosylhydrolase [Alsobacter ponti]MCP8939762.1 family 16 glycosylhydrolase [Alsobacter ponti]
MFGSTAVPIDPFAIGDGVLNIQAKPTPSTWLSTLSDHPYTSGMINTGAGAFDFKYGYVEVRAQIPAGTGLLPTFYMVRADKAQLGEIDLFEILGNKTNYLNSTVHYSTNGTGITDIAKVVRTTVGTDLSKGYHNYGVDWNEQKITFYLDGVAMGSIATPESLKAPMFIIGHIGVGGTWTGNPDGSTPWPANMKVDYVKVYQDGALLNPVSKTGGAGSESMSGNDGNDVLRGADGNDTVLGARGNDSIDGGAGADRLMGGMGADTLLGGGGADTLEGGRGNDVYLIHETGDVINDLGVTDFDTVETTLASFSAISTIEGLTYKGTGAFKGTGAGNNNVITGAGGADTLLGGAGHDTLYGNAGSDKLNGGVGNDALYSGTGNDTLLGDSGADLFVLTPRDGAGSTLVADFQRGTDKLNVAGLGFTDFSDVTAHSSMNGQGNLVLSKNGESVVLQGLKTGQLTSGDFVWSSDPAPSSSTTSPTPSTSTDTGSTSDSGLNLVGTSGANLLNGGSAGDSLTGCDGADTLNGAGGDDWMNGGAGADRLNPGTGHDTLIGNAGVDVFVFSSASIASRSEVMDFAAGTDRLSVGGLGLHSMTDVTANAVNNAQGYAQITAGNETIVLHGVKVADLHAADFIF